FAVRPRAGLGPVQRAGPLGRPLHVETDRVGAAACYSRLPVLLAQLPRRARIDRHAIGIARPALADVAVGDHARKISPAFERWERQPPRVELLQRRAVFAEM